MAATYRRIDMKALARYQLILLGEQRHIGVNNLPKVVARQCCDRESNPRSGDRESGALTTTPPSMGSSTGVVSSDIPSDCETLCSRRWLSRYRYLDLVITCW